jgi:prefoldin subunit 5
MGLEPVEELPEDLEAWVAERAADSDASRADIVRRLLAAHKLLDDHPDWLEDAPVPDRTDGTADPPDEVDDVDARVGDLAERVGELEGDLDDKIADVRQRVIQVKREADAKAPADHDHPSLERRVDEGFGNYEEVLEYLTERTETLEDETDDRSAKLRSVANAVVDLRRRVATLESEREKRDAVSDLREAANRHGVSEAACGSCGESVHVGLLDEPACPHCESPFDGVEPGGWFRPDTLTVGDPPALEPGPAAPDATDSSGPTGSSEPTPASPSDGGGTEPSGSDPSAATAGDGSEDGGHQDDGPGIDDIVDDASDGSHGDSGSAAGARGFAGEPVEGDGDDDTVSDDPLATGSLSDGWTQADPEEEDGR